VEFRGPFQAALAHILGGHNRELLHTNLGLNNCALCGDVRTVAINGPGHDVTRPEFEVDIRGVPARFINQAESLPDGHFYEGLRLFHMKGSWWRECAYGGWAMCFTFEKIFIY